MSVDLTGHMGVGAPLPLLTPVHVTSCDPQVWKLSSPEHLSINTHRTNNDWTPKLCCGNPPGLQTPVSQQETGKTKGGSLCPNSTFRIFCKCIEPGKPSWYPEPMTLQCLQHPEFEMDA